MLCGRHGDEPLRLRILLKLHRALEGWTKSSIQTQSPKHGRVPSLAESASTPIPTYLGSTELSGLAFGGDGTLGSATALPEDPCRASGTGPDGGGGGFGSISLAEVRRCSFTSFSRDLALCSAKRRSNCFFRPGTALRWLSEWVYGEERGEAQPL